MKNLIGQPTDPNQITVLKTIWNMHSDKWKAAYIDPRFLELLERINATPNMATMYHCSGHIEGEKEFEINVINSYMVICASGDMADRMNKMFNEIHQENPEIFTPTGFHNGYEVGWSVDLSDTPLTPWYHGARGLGHTANTWCIYHIFKTEQDPDGMKTVQAWNDLFNKHIFN